MQYLEKEELKNIKEKFPFLTIGYYNITNSFYVGIIHGYQKDFLNLYDYNSIKNKNLKKIFLLLGDKWWWESNRKIPINIYFYKEFQIFNNCIKKFQKKNFSIYYTPPNVKLENFYQKKKKNIKVNYLPST